jgi:type I restriction enzyme R subunit
MLTMPKINEAERKTQDRVIALFRDEAALGYAYYGNLRYQTNANIMTDKLTEWLIGRGYGADLSAKAVDALVRAAGNLQQGLYKANQDVYSLLEYGARIIKNPGEPPKTAYFIDWEHSHNNGYWKIIQMPVF